MSAPNPFPLHPAAVALSVRDLGRVAAFYRDIVGLSVTGQGDGSVELGAAGVGFLTLVHRPEALPDDTAEAGLYHNAFLLPSRAAMGAWLEHARVSGVALDGAADHLVSEAVYLHDPEGNGVEIYADRPPQHWEWEVASGAPQLRMANARLDFAGLAAAATERWEGAPQGTRLGHVHLRVGDVARAVGFYAGILGFDVTRAMPQAAFLSTAGYHHHLGANMWHSAGSVPRNPARSGLAWMTLQAGDAAILGQIAARSHTPDLAISGLRDPWGTQIKFTLDTEHRR